MNIIGHGIDIVDVAEMRRWIEDPRDPLIPRCFSPAEVEEIGAGPDRVERLAGRFAAKEAALKALGTGWTADVDWKQIEITNEPSGQPTITLNGQAAELANAAGAKHFFVSISHSPHLATAEVIFET